MRLRSVAMLVTVLAMATGGCSDDTSTESETTTTEPAPTTTSEVDSPTDDESLQSLQDLLAAQGIDESLATFGVEWCTHQDLAMLAREVGSIELAERVAAAASEAAC